MPSHEPEPSRPALPPARAPTRAGGFGHIEAWIFDLDNTLYPASCNLFDQVDRRIGEFMVQFLQIEADEARRLQKQYFRDYGTTLRGLMTRHAVAPRRFLDYVHAIDLSPVPPSPALDAALGRLEGRKIIFTNGSEAHAENVMTRLGVGRHFEGVFDIVAAAYLPKPEPAAYASLVERHRVDPRAAAMFEDLPRNLAPAAALGMTTVLVRSDADPGCAGGGFAEASWAQAGADGDHIHHVTDDLVAWLEAAARRPT